jgi:hypothetical protein
MRPHERDRMALDPRWPKRSALKTCRHQVESDLVPIRGFIDTQMVDNILGVLQFELSTLDRGRDPNRDDIRAFLIESKPADVLRTIRMHPTMRGLESLTKSDRRLLRWCAMLSKSL